MANENQKHYLDQAGLAKVWEAVGNKVTTAVEAEETRAKGVEDTKVTAEVKGTNGTSQILQEGDGGGAHFIHNDGSESYVGVNDGGKDGMMAQIYADVQEDGAWVGSRINVYHEGIYYVSKANQKAGFAKNAADMEIATKKDIKDLGQALHFVGIATQNEGETEAQAVERTFPAASQTAGAVAICGAKEFICAGTPLTWYEFGDVSAYATKAELEAEAATRESADETLQGNIDTEATRAKAEEAKKVNLPKEPVAGQGVNVPYYFSVAYAADKATVHDYTVDLLDNTKAFGEYTMDINGASASAAGLMIASDKEKLDNIGTMTTAEIEAICK